jgi:transketolase
MRNQFAKSIFELSKKNKKIHVVVADISPAGKMQDFQKKFPDRFINVGVAEQSMIGMAAGLAMNKKKVFAYTISTFSLYRPFEMIRVDLCYQNLPVCVVGMGAGTIYANLGATHLTQEDISIARSIPNLSVLSPSDPYELDQAVNYFCKSSTGPMYLRIGKTGEPNFKFSETETWKFGKLRKIKEGKDLCFLSYGPIMKMVINISKKLEKSNKTSEIYSCHTIKPFDTKRLRKIFNKFKNIVVIEDHSYLGGLSSIVKQLAYENNYYGKIYSYGLKDKFLHSYSSQKDLLKKHGIDEIKIINQLKKI